MDVVVLHKDGLVMVVEGGLIPFMYYFLAKI